MLLHRRSEPGGPTPPRRTDHGSGRALVGDGPNTILLQGGHAGVVALQLGQPGCGVVAVGDHLGERIGVLAPEVAELLASLADLGQPRGVLVDALGTVAQLRGDVDELGDHSLQPGREGDVRGPPAHRGERARGHVAGTVVVGEHGGSTKTRRAVLHRVGQRLLQRGQSVVLVGVLQLSGLQLGELEAQQVDLAQAGATVAAERGERRIDLGEAGTRSAHGGEIDIGGSVERVTLGRCGEQALVGVLAVEVHGARPSSASCAAVASRPSM